MTNGVGRLNRRTVSVALLYPVFHALPAASQEETRAVELLRRLDQARRPKVLNVPRQGMFQDFAVLLLRSSYAAVDQLDFVAMDQFQKNFWKFRQGEYEDYVSRCGGKIQQGILTDPNYFDFISFAQYASIGAAMKKGEVVFNEATGYEGDEQVVVRQQYLDNLQLPAAHTSMVGEAIVEFLGNQSYGAQPTQQPSFAELTAQLRQFMVALKFQRYALTIDLTPNPADRSFVLNLNAPATLWSQQVLAQRGDFANDFEMKGVEEFIRQCGYKIAYQTSYTSVDITHTIKVLGNIRS